MNGYYYSLSHDDGYWRMQRVGSEFNSEYNCYDLTVEALNFKNNNNLDFSGFSPYVTSLDNTIAEFDKLTNNTNEYNATAYVGGKTSSWQIYIPVWGSCMQAGDELCNGNYLNALMYAGLG